VSHHAAGNPYTSSQQTQESTMTEPQEQTDTEEPITKRDPRGPRENQNKKDEDDSEGISSEADFIIGTQRGKKLEE